MLTAFLTFLLVFIVIGIFAAQKGRNTPEDYYLASQVSILCLWDFLLLLQQTVVICSSVLLVIPMRLAYRLCG